MNNRLVPLHSKLQEKKAAIRIACELAPKLKQRVEEYTRLKQTRRSPHRQTPRPTLSAMYSELLRYPLGLYSNPLSFTEPMLHRADSLVSDSLGLIRTGHIEGIFTPGDYQQLTERLALVREIIEEVYYIETKRPNEGKVGDHPNARTATPETRAKAIDEVRFYRDPAYQTKVKELITGKLRSDVLKDALDEMVILEQSRTIENLHLLARILDDYLPKFKNALCDISDGYVKATKRIIARAMKYGRETGIVIESDCRAIRCNLEQALAALLREP